MALTITPEDAADEWDLAKWLEYMAERKPGGPSAFSFQQQSASEVIRVAGNQVRSCVRQVSGYSLADNTSFALTREEVPLQHPWWPGLWADATSVQYVNPLGSPDYPVTGGFQPKKPGIADELYGPLVTGNYGSAEVTVQFRNYPWTVWSDADPGWLTYFDDAAGVSRYQEWRRLLVNSSVTPKLDLINSQGVSEDGKLYFAEYDPAAIADSPKAGPGIFPFNGTPFDGAVYARVQQTGYEICWRQVEEQYLIGGYPADIHDALAMPNLARLDAYLGYVNSTPFLGHPKNTLLFSGWHGVRASFPGVRTNFQFGLIGWDIYLVLDKYDPLRPPTVSDFAGLPIAEVDRKRGHLVFPYRPNPKHYNFTATSGNTTDQGTYDGSTALGELELRDLFRHRDDPAYPLPT